MLCKPRRGVIHRGRRIWKQGEYLLKTHSFPHSPQFSPQGFSTTPERMWTVGGIYIKMPDILRPTSHFFAGRVFYHSIFFVQKSGLDKHTPEKTGSAATLACRKYPARNAKKILKRGLILFGKDAIMCIRMENYKRGGVIHAQH